MINKLLKNKKADLDVLFKILLWVVVFALLIAGITFLTKRLMQG